MEPWEDELLWDDDFSDEEEDTEEQIEEADLEMDEDSFADWKDSSDGALVDETLEEALAEERVTIRIGVASASALVTVGGSQSRGR